MCQLFRAMGCVMTIGMVGCLTMAESRTETPLQTRTIRELSGAWEYTDPDGSRATVTVPHCWNIADAAGGVTAVAQDSKSVNSQHYKRGKAFYTQTFDVEPSSQKRLFVRCGGAGIVTRVLVNEKAVGLHEGAFTAFCFEITEAVVEGENTITVEVDTTYRDHIAPLRGDFSIFGGLYRPVMLIETPRVCIDPLFYGSPGLFITPTVVGAGATIDVAVRVSNGDNAARPCTLTATLLDAAGTCVATTTTETTLAAQTVECVKTAFALDEVRLWKGREDPYLYTVRVTVTDAQGNTDVVEQPCGVRTIAIDPQRGFLLNGQARQLRGVSRHQDKEGKGWALSAADEAQDIALILEMGCDALRTAHYPQSTHLYDLCDRAGLIVWSEVSNVNLVRDSAAFRQQNRTFAREMIYQHWNHPSLCLWGYFNEIGHQPEAGLTIDQMADELVEMERFIRALDPHRPTACVSNQPQATKLNNVSMHIAFNTYPGWYNAAPEAMEHNIRRFLKHYGAKGVGISEYGHGASITQHEQNPKQPQPTGAWHPEEWQSVAHEANYAALKRHPEIWGGFIWNMFDFGSSNRSEGGQKGINDKGLVTYDRAVKKDAFWFYRANWNKEPMLYLTSRRHTLRDSKVSTTTPVKVYTTAPEVELFVNGVSLGKQTADSLHRVIWPAVQLQPGPNTVEVRAGTLVDSCVWELK